MGDARSFLVINVSRIGDTLLVTPALRSIARAFPSSEISVMCHPKRAEVLRHIPFITRVSGISKRTAPWKGWLARRRYEYALVYGFDKALVAYALRVAQYVVAFKQSDAALDRRLYRAVDLPAFQSEHSVMQLLRLPAVLDCPPAELRVAYRVLPAEHEWATSQLAKDLPRIASPLVGLQVASFHTKSYRDWPIERFVETTKQLTTQWPEVHFLIFGGTAERARTGWLNQQLGCRATNYAGSLSLRQTAAVMSLIDLYIGVDTGPTHIMSAFDRPMVVLYHCFSPSRLIGPLEHPCFYPVDHPRPYGCPPETPMGEISVDAVVVAARRAIEARRATVRSAG